jgi:effector-binding domain-containing protein
MKTKLSTLIIISLIVSSFTVLCAQDTEKKYSHTDILVKEIDAQKALVMKADIPSSAIGEKMGEMYSTLFPYLQTKGIAPAGATFAVYYSYDPNGNTVFEAGVPIAEATEGNENITYKEFPVMKVVSTLYTGAYEDMSPVYIEIQQYMEENKIEWTGTSWEVYLTDPSMVKDKSQNKTIIYFPVK